MFPNIFNQQFVEGHMGGHDDKYDKTYNPLIFNFFSSKRFTFTTKITVVKLSCLY